MILDSQLEIYLMFLWRDTGSRTEENQSRQLADVGHTALIAAAANSEVICDLLARTVLHPHQAFGQQLEVHIWTGHQCTGIERGIKLDLGLGGSVEFPVSFQGKKVWGETRRW